MSNEFAEYCDRLWKIAYERGKTEGETMTTPRMIAIMTVIVASFISALISLVFALIDRKRPPK